ncbi:hypothetical protein, partial [Streptococcus pseudopneumoniae]|uniref:hypothetical protein n=1 Tax=Streptococcus pseudopneumoniae TaxID=257758 RepID=UPI001486E9BF
GVSTIEKPIVYEREAGWRETNHDCYIPRFNEPPFQEVTYCWQVPCSTIFPCDQMYSASGKAVQARDNCVIISP